MLPTIVPPGIGLARAAMLSLFTASGATAVRGSAGVAWADGAPTVSQGTVSMTSRAKALLASVSAVLTARCRFIVCKPALVGTVALFGLGRCRGDDFCWSRFRWLA